MIRYFYIKLDNVSNIFIYNSVLILQGRQGYLLNNFSNWLCNSSTKFPCTERAKASDWQQFVGMVMCTAHQLIGAAVSSGSSDWQLQPGGHAKAPTAKCRHTPGSGAVPWQLVATGEVGNYIVEFFLHLNRRNIVAWSYLVYLTYKGIQDKLKE